jgi:hypothetical protein
MSWTSTIAGYSPAVFLRLGEASGLTTPFTAADASGNSNSGTYSNSGGSLSNVTLGVAGSVPSDSDTAATFASGGKVAIADAAALKPGSGAFAVMIAVKTTASGLVVVVGKFSGSGDDYWLGISSGKAQFNIGFASAASTTNVNDGNWHLIIGSRDGSGNMTVCVDGNAEGTSGNAASISPAGNLVVGNFGDSGGFPYVGSVDEFAYFPAHIDATAAAAIYAAWVAAGSSSMSASPTSIDPHTAGITVTLTRSVSGWTGETFTVSGVSGTIKTAQNITSGTSATITLTTGTSAGTLTISDGTLTYDITVATKKVVDGTSGTASFRVLEPANYDGSTARGLVFYYHGSSGGANDVTNDPLVTPLVNRFLADGYLVVGANAGASNWGNPSGLTVYADAHAYVLANWNVTNVVLLPYSMGGLAAFQTIRSPSTYPRIKGVYAIYPCCDILADYDDSGALQALILGGWSVADRAALVTAIAGHNPVDLSAAGLPNIRYRFHASAGDTLVLKSHNTDAMRTLLGGTTTVENTLVTTSGNHGDASNFDPDDASAFVANALADVSITSAPPASIMLLGVG